MNPLHFQEKTWSILSSHNESYGYWSHKVFFAAGTSQEMHAIAALKCSGKRHTLDFRYTPFQRTFISFTSGTRNTFREPHSLSKPGVIPTTMIFSHLNRILLGRWRLARYSQLSLRRTPSGTASAVHLREVSDLYRVDITWPQEF